VGGPPASAEQHDQVCLSRHAASPGLQYCQKSLPLPATPHPSPQPLLQCRRERAWQNVAGARDGQLGVGLVCKHRTRVDFGKGMTTCHETQDHHQVTYLGQAGVWHDHHTQPLGDSPRESPPPQHELLIGVKQARATHSADPAAWTTTAAASRELLKPRGAPTHVDVRTVLS